MAIPVMRWIGDRITKAVCRQKKEVKQKSEKLNQRQNSNGHIQMGWWKIWCSGTNLSLFAEGKRLIEPFVGGGAVFMNAGTRKIC